MNKGIFWARSKLLNKSWIVKGRDVEEVVYKVVQAEALRLKELELISPSGNIDLDLEIKMFDTDFMEI
jgi:hypothetical protein